MQNEIPSIFPSEINEIAFSQIRISIVEHTELLKRDHNIRQPNHHAHNKQVTQMASFLMGM